MDTVTSAKRSEMMRAIKSNNTRPEIEVRRLLHHAGYRYRLHRKDLPGKPDIVFPGRKKVVLVHGCFWHQHSCPVGHRPRSNNAYWDAKLKRNIERDAKTMALLSDQGWQVFVAWECQIKHKETLLEDLKRFLET